MKRSPEIPRTGDGSSEWNGDGVFTGREPHNSLRNPMTALEIQMLKQQVAELSKDEKFQFQTEFTSRRRNTGTGIALALLLGCFGAHKFYLKQNTAGVLYAIGGTIGWALIVPGWIVVILSIIDACGMGNSVQKVNRDVAVELRREIEAFRN